MTDDAAVDAHPEAGAVQGVEAPSGASGMTPDDAAASAYDDWDRSTNGIAEGERENIGQYLKYHADSAGTTVISGLNSLIEPAITMRHGSMEQKRAVLGHLVDEYQIRARPEAQSQPIEYGPPAAGAEGLPVVSEDEGMAVVQQFISENPVAQDDLIQSYMVDIVGDMRAQGYQPDLGRALEIAIQHHPRYSEQAQAARQAGEVARSKAAGVQVSGSGTTSPNQTSDDVADIINELTPGW